MIEQYKSEIIAGVAGILASAITLAFARRKNNAEADSTLADGVAKIVSTSNELLEMTKKSLQEEREHHKQCNARVEKLETEVAQLKNFHK